MVSAMFAYTHFLNFCFSFVWRNVQCPHQTPQSSNRQPVYPGNYGEKHNVFINVYVVFQVTTDKKKSMHLRKLPTPNS